MRISRFRAAFKILVYLVVYSLATSQPYLVRVLAHAVQLRNGILERLPGHLARLLRVPQHLFANTLEDYRRLWKIQKVSPQNSWLCTDNIAIDPHFFVHVFRLSQHRRTQLFPTCAISGVRSTTRTPCLRLETRKNLSKRMIQSHSNGRQYP